MESVCGVSRRSPLLTLVFACCLSSVVAEPLSKRTEIDFFRDVPSRNLKGLATRSDGRLVGGPVLIELAAPAAADLLWCLEPTQDPRKFLIGSGPDGRIFEITLGADDKSYTARELSKLADPQVFALRALPDGSLLAGTSPKGALYLLRGGQPVSKMHLPVDSIFDILQVGPETVLIATGNPGRIYRVDVRKFATNGLVADKITDTKVLADRGITLFGEVRDRNVRRLAAMPDGRVIAGSAPKGNVYTFPPNGGPPVILQENREAEVTDLLPQPNGDLFATIVFSATTGDARVAPRNAPPTPAQPEGPLPPMQVDRFNGRSSLVWFPANGFPETLTTRNAAAFYSLSRLGDTLLIAGGDTGELLGYDLRSRLSLTFPGSVSAQLNDLAPFAPGKFVVLKNNSPGLALLDFNATGPREAETRRIELGAVPSVLGALRFNRLRNIAPGDLAVEARVNNGTDEVEGWGPWTPLALNADEGRRAENLRGRTAKFRLRLPPVSPASSTQQARQASPEIDRGTLFFLPQNRRPQLQEFRVLSPGYGLVLAIDPPRNPVVSLNQLLQGAARDEEKRRETFTSSQIVPQPGSQVVLWNILDPDGDQFTSTFSYRREDDQTWTDVITGTRESYAQFDTSHLPDGIYFTRLIATETAPRPAAERLAQTFETDDLIIDHTPPEITQATAQPSVDRITVTVSGRDKLSLIEAAELVFSNGIREMIEQPSDGVRDGREETFVVDVPLPRVSNATSVEVTLYDAAGNSAARRLTW